MININNYYAVKHFHGKSLLVYPVPFTNATNKSATEEKKMLGRPNSYTFHAH